MNFKRSIPTKEDKLRLPGKNNVETLLLCIDARLSQPTELLLVGRASYEVDNPLLAKTLQGRLEEIPRIHPIRNIPILTEDVDGFATDATEAITALAFKGSFLAELCDTYFHPLGEETLFLPKNWEKRIQPLPLEGIEKLTISRLHPLDFILCKAAAGREKDKRFLEAFREEKNITQDQIQTHWETTDGKNHPKVKDSPIILLSIKRSLGFSPAKSTTLQIEMD